MQLLPQSVEAYLLDAGFSATELTILRRLLDGEEFSTRELATKTGKSSGVLDQAVKKLMQKGIVERAYINAVSRYTLAPLSAILRWMEVDTMQKRDELLRRHQNFEAFINSIEIDRIRPVMEFFDGEEGIKMAYRKLLEKNRELLQFYPVTLSAEDDPLREFRVEFFRERRARKVFARIIAHDTPMGRRFQSRDPFEYRQTRLIPEDECPFTFEKIISGNIVACFNHIDKRVCFIDYPELAQTERSLFERHWKLEGLEQAKAEAAARAAMEIQAAEAVVDPEPDPDASMPPLSTRTLSALREFFLSRSSLAMFGVFAIISGALSWGMYRYTEQLSFQRLATQAQSIASTAAFQFDANDLNALRQEQDWKKPEWGKVVRQLERVRLNNPDVTFVYIFRKMPLQPGKMEFVADSHSLNPYANTDDDPLNDIDVDHDGEIGTKDYLQWPGQYYPTPPSEGFDAYEKVTSTNSVYTDSWGTYLTGYSPIRDSEGKTVAVLAVDISESKIKYLVRTTIAPMSLFFVILLTLLAARLMALNKSLIREIFHLAQTKNLLKVLVICVLVASSLTAALYYYSYVILKKEASAKLMHIASTAASEFNSEDLDQIHFARDMKLPAYQRIYKKLNEVRNDNRDINIKYVYIFRKTIEPNILEFVADADSNFDSWLKQQEPLTGIEPIASGTSYDISNQPAFFKDAFEEPAITNAVFSDKWGTHISGGAPILNQNYQAIAMLGIDIDISDLRSELLNTFKLWLWFNVILCSTLILTYCSRLFRKVL